jgi:signal peptidase I
MSSVADYAHVEARHARRPLPWVATLLTILTPGLGHFYIGQARRGIVLFALVLVANVLLLLALMCVLARFWLIATSGALLVGLWFFIMIDATVRAARMQDHPRHRYNQWPIYAGAVIISCLVTAIPLVYGANASALGRLGIFRAATSSMEPTLRHHEYFLADSTYYQHYQPSRGDVAVYVSPRQPERHCIKRIVAVEGDRIAITAGRVVWNGMAVAEPYIEPGAPAAASLNMAETRVPPKHVFVLGDNRVDTVDSCDGGPHAPVPVGNLRGRVTDIAFSRDMRRMGRWIGTASKL